MSTLKEQLAAANTIIAAREKERLQIYADSQVDEQEHPRLNVINRELEHVWDLKRRIEAAISAGLSELPVPPPAYPEDMIG